MQSQEGSKLSKKVGIFAAVIITVAVILAITSSWNDSIIVDEVPHIGAGYSYLVKQDMRLNPEHPPLAKDLAAIPLLFLNLNQGAFNTAFWQTDVNGQWDFGRYLIFESGNNADLIKHLARLPMLLFFVLSAVLIFKWARRLYGNAGAFIALTLFSFSSTVIAHSRFVTTDMAALFGVLLATYYFVRYLKAPSGKRLFIAGLTFGIALLLKFSTFLLVPFFFVLAIIYGFVSNRQKILTAWRLTLGTVLIFLVGFMIIVWPVYYFHTYNYPPERQYRDTQQLLATYGNRNFAEPIIWASDKPVLRAAAQYGLGLLMVSQRSVGGNTTYFLGEVSRFGWHKYFPIVYFIKEPLAWWGLVLVSLLFLGWQTKKPSKEFFTHAGNFIKNHTDELVMLLWLLVYWGVSINSTLNIGVRHLLPTYPFAILLVSGQIAKMVQKAKENFNFKSKALIFTVFFLLSWYVVENIKVYPLYLTYFNQAAGGPSGGYRYVTDSNLDWGQDLIRFSDWVKENNIPKIELDYFGWADQSYYLGSHFEWLWREKYSGAEDFKARNKSDGWLAISITYLQETQGPVERPQYPNYLWLKSYQPVTIIGHSIFVYRIQ